MSNASLERAVGQAVSLWPEEAADDDRPGSRPAGVCGSLIDDIRLLQTELSLMGQELQRIRSATRRIRLRVLRLHKARRQRLKQADLGGVGETALAEMVLAAQRQTKRRPTRSRKLGKRLRCKRLEDVAPSVPGPRDETSQKSRFVDLMRLKPLLKKAFD
jgi:hypothetical protein